MKNQKGFSLVEGLLIIIIVTVVGFGSYYVWNQNKSSETQQQEITIESSEQESNIKNMPETNEYTNYSNSAFGFTLKYPANLTATQANVYDGYEGAGKTMNFIIDDDVFVLANTKDYDLGPKGPVPLSAMVARGYVENNNELYYSDGQSKLTADSIEKRDNYLYIINKITFQGDENSVEYIALFNTSNGGLVIYTVNPDKISLIQKIAATVSIN